MSPCPQNGVNRRAAVDVYDGGGGGGGHLAADLKRVLRGGRTSCLLGGDQLGMCNFVCTWDAVVRRVFLRNGATIGRWDLGFFLRYLQKEGLSLLEFHLCRVRDKKLKIYTSTTIFETPLNTPRVINPDRS